MLFSKQWKCFLFYLITFIMIDRKQIESNTHLLSRIAFGQKVPIEAVLAGRFKSFLENIKLDQSLKHEQELEKKRNEIFQKYLLSRVSGSILKDFYNRL